jgi:hypothetical protein
MKTILRTILGVILIVIAIAMFVEYPFPAFLLIIMALMTIPFTLDYFERTTNKKLTQIQLIWAFIIMGVFFFAGIGATDDSRAKRKNQADSTVSEYKAVPRDTVAERKAMIQAKEDNSQGENYNLSYYIKSQLDDPDSYEHAKTIWLDGGDRIVAYVTFRANNRFGAKIKTTYEIVMTDNEEILSVKQLQ